MYSIDSKAPAGCAALPAESTSIDQHLVTQVGVDVNLAAQTPWLAHQLQFVAGLGPRKATSLLKAVQRQEQVASRKAVWRELNVIGKKVFWQVMTTVCSSNYTALLWRCFNSLAFRDRLSMIHQSTIQLPTCTTQLLVAPCKGHSDQLSTPAPSTAWKHFSHKYHGHFLPTGMQLVVSGSGALQLALQMRSLTRWTTSKSIVTLSALEILLTQSLTVL